MRARVSYMKERITMYGDVAARSTGEIWCPTIKPNLHCIVVSPCVPKSWLQIQLHCCRRSSVWVLWLQAGGKKDSWKRYDRIYSSEHVWGNAELPPQQKERAFFLACWHSGPDLYKLQEDKANCLQLDEVCHDAGVVNLVIRAHLHPELEELTRQKSRRWPDSFKLALAFLFAACLTAESRCRAGERSAEETAARTGPACQKPGAPLTLATLGQVSAAKLGARDPLETDGFLKKPSCIFQKRRERKDGLESAQGLQSHFPLISKPYGWISLLAKALHRGQAGWNWPWQDITIKLMY